MNLPIKLSPLAQSDLEEAALWYEREAAMGEAIVAEVEAALKRIEQAPTLHSPVFMQIRRARVHRFPYGIYYRVEPARITVIAIFHNHRNPETWQARIQ